MVEILTRVSGWAGGRAQALAWYRGEPIPAFGDRTAEQLVKSGKAGALRDYLDLSRWAALREVYRPRLPRPRSPLGVSAALGEAAAARGGRFNPKGTPALYLALDPMAAVKEASQGFAHKFEPCVLCSYEIDCDDIVDLRTADLRRAAGVAEADMACAWFAEAAAAAAHPLRSGSPSG